MILYHATTIDRINSIKEYGIFPHKKYAYFTSNLKHAIDFAKRRAIQRNSIGVIISCIVSNAKKIREDIFRTIHVSYIKDIIYLVDKKGDIQNYSYNMPEFSI